MKLKTINAVICKKFDAWIATIEDQSVKALVEKNTICTGGAIASMLLNEDINDFDFYFRDLDTTRAVAKYYVNKFKANASPKFAGGGSVDIRVDENADDDQGKMRIRVIVKSAGIASSEGDEGYQYFEGQPDQEGAEYIAKVLDNGEQAKAPEGEAKDKPKYRPVFLSTNAITLSDDVQIVVRFYGEPDEIHANYDYVHVTNYWTSWNRTVTVKQAALLALMNKDLRYIGSRYPLCSLFRARKFIQRGWKITAGQLLKIAMNLQKYDLRNVAVLEEQLTGVDVAYFNDLIERIKKEEADKGTTAADVIASGKFDVDASYLAELIDKLF